MMLLVPLTMFVLGLALRVGMGMCYGARGPGDDSALFILWQIASSVLMGGALAVWMLIPLASAGLISNNYLFLYSGGGSALLCLAVMLGVIAGFALVESILSGREHQRHTNAKLLAIAAREGTVPQVAELLDDVASGAYVGAAARQLAHELHSGQPLYDSIARNRGALPSEATAYAAVGTVAKAEAAALDELSRPENSLLLEARRNWRDRSAYAVAMAAGMTVMLSGFFVGLLSTFRDILYEFQLELPPATDWLLSFAEGGSVAWVLIALLLMLCLGAMFIIMIMYLCNYPALQGISDWLLRSQQTASALRMIALAIEQRADLARAIYAMSVTHPASAIRARLANAYLDISAGNAWPDALVANRLLRPSDQGLVETAEQVGNLPWALRQIAHRRESQLAVRMTTVTNIVYPAMILALGLLIGFVVISLFLPLVGLVRGLS